MAQKIFASAEHAHAYTGKFGPAVLVAVRTTRRGERVTRYTWHDENGANCGHWRDTMHPSVAHAIERARQLPAFRNIRAAWAARHTTTEESTNDNGI